jgi:putative serine protease PepD
MASSLFDPPAEHRTPDLPPPPPPPPPRPTGRGRSGPPRRRAPLALLLTMSALLGGGASAGVLVATGAVGSSSTRTTVVERSGSGSTSDASGTSSGSAASIDAQALYDDTSAGVVDITAKGVATDSGGQSQSPFGGPQQQQSETTATGTGFVVDGKGNIVTAAHVVDGASSVTVTFQNGTTRKATVLGQDDATDVAVLKVDPSGLTLKPLELGSSKDLDEGVAVAAVGDPFGYQRSISTGIVSGLDRTIEAPNGFTVAHAIQTDAALNPGNSGGPLLDSQGRVVGIVDQIATGSSGAEQSSGVGFAVPIDLVSSELSRLEAGQTVRHAYIGVSTGSSGGSDGAVIASVTSGGPAAAAGLRTGDVVTRIGDAKVEDSNDLVAAVAEHQPGDKVTVTVQRGSDTRQVTVTLGTQPSSSTSSSSSGG